ncbi:RpiB/LacA/LacB family sugar-phosphate isomerase [Candidatus Saccharibacteria bacterium]|jgi:ribose 5-phosphate isomerase B|nr:RpiB/LacA/LacB family sugar-phosphate isomerase [Candidatus Saccharibacteria bacterium]HPR09493.1 RpiB/LacA/LacB family sugar-phosphate isomerase [Candidatus Saccharibacteria bacterium]
MDKKPTIYIGADHNGYELKAKLTDYLQRGGYTVSDEGDREQHPDDDFPQFAAQVIHAMATDPSYDVRGILLCGSGQGMCMAANRYKGIRAVLGYNQESARSSRNDDDSNVLCLPARELDFEGAISIMHTWLLTPFADAPRYKRRIEQLDQLG